METSTEHWLQPRATNLTGAFFCCREVIPVMRRQQYGRIINVTSGLSVNNLPNYGAYNVSKAGLNALTRTLAAELQGTGILVNGLDPGVVRSNMSPTASTPPEEVMPGALFLATLPPDGPTGRFFNKRGDERGW
jgi:3-oxoacyl-[acyl-carrier protein] reductase